LKRHYEVKQKYGLKFKKRTFDCFLAILLRMILGDDEAKIMEGEKNIRESQVDFKLELWEDKKEWQKQSKEFCTWIYKTLGWDESQLKLDNLKIKKISDKVSEVGGGNFMTLEGDLYNNLSVINFVYNGGKRQALKLYDIERLVKNSNAELEIYKVKWGGNILAQKKIQQCSQDILKTALPVSFMIIQRSDLDIQKKVKLLQEFIAKITKEQSREGVYEIFPVKFPDQ